MAFCADQSAAQSPVTLTQIGSPIWRPVDFQTFIAPIEPQAAGDATTAKLLPLDPLFGATTYTTPHQPPYDTELSTGAAAAGFVNQTVFPREAILGNPLGVLLAFILLPDPGIIGSSRDFASGPVIPNSLLPLAASSEIWKDGALSLDQGDGPFPVRPTDEPFDGASHRFAFSSYWNRGANNLGNYEYRWSLVDLEGHGWEIVAPFQVVRAGDFDADGDVDAADLPKWSAGFGKTAGALHAEGDADFDGDVDGADFLRWQRQVGQSSTVAAIATVPEPSAVVSLCLGAAGLGARARRRRMCWLGRQL
jgi:hypothetical protein